MAEIPQSHQDLLESQVATLATIGPDGRPQLSEVWFVGTDGTVRISLNTSRQKVKNLQRNPSCTVFLLDLADPYRYVEIRGDAEITPDADYAFADEVAAKYNADLRVHDKPGESRVAVAIRPAKINAVNMHG
jgi:PPOX class probable F420-dependent enzyme